MRSSAWLRELSFFEKLERMMDEVPEKYLGDEYPEMPLSPDVKWVGRLTNAEKRLLSVIRWLEDMGKLEDEAHMIAHSNSNHTRGDCIEYHEKTVPKDEFLGACVGCLTLSIRERLFLHDRFFVFERDNIFAYLNPDIHRLRVAEILLRSTGSAAQAVCRIDSGDYLSDYFSKNPELVKKKMN